MKYLLACWCLVCVAACDKAPRTAPPRGTVFNRDTILQKQKDNPYVQVDVSPMDMAYFPADFAVKKSEVGFPAQPDARVIYSRPHRGGRTLFGNIIAWGKPWRVGANEATEIEFFRPASIQGKSVPPGRYILYAIPYADKWEIVFNKHLYTWGLKFDATKDLFRFEVPVVSNKPSVEDFTMLFVKTATGANLLMAWETTEVRLPIQF